jgi:hypothetical protein
MSDEFKTNPGKVIIKGNVVTGRLASLDSTDGWTTHQATISTDGTETINGVSFKALKLVYKADDE